MQLTIELGAAGYRQLDATMGASEALEKFREIQRMYRAPRLRPCGQAIKIYTNDHGEQFRGIEWVQHGNILVGLRRYGPAYPENDDLTSTDVHILALGVKTHPLIEDLGAARGIRTLHFAERLAFVHCDADQDLIVLRGHPSTLHFVNLGTGAVHEKRRLETDLTGELVIPHLWE